MPARKGATLFAATTGLPLQTERECRHVGAAFWPRLGSRPAGIPPLRGFGGDGACAVATEKDLRCRNATHPVRRRSPRPSARRSLKALERMARVRLAAGPN